MTRALMLLLVFACTGRDRSTTEQDVPQPSAVVPQPSADVRRAQPPPPPPPPAPTPQPPPASVATFLNAHASSAEPWQAFVYELAASRKGAAPRFLGHEIVKRRQVSEANANDLAARLGRETSYVDGDYGCVGDPVGFRIARGAASLDFTVDCGHLALDVDDDHAALLSEEMIDFLNSLRAPR